MTATKFRTVAIDDDEDILDLIRLSLEDEFEILTFHDPQQALDNIQYIQPDIAILDIMMPKVTGYHIAEEIHRTMGTNGCDIIFLSAKSSPRDIRYGYKLGANYYMTKPFVPERLKRAIHTMLEEQTHRTEPHKKLYSMRDIQLRLENKVAKFPTGFNPFEWVGENPQPHANRRHKGDEDDRLHWEG